MLFSPVKCEIKEEVMGEIREEIKTMKIEKIETESMKVQGRPAKITKTVVKREIKTRVRKEAKKVVRTDVDATAMSESGAVIVQVEMSAAKKRKSKALKIKIDKSNASASEIIGVLVEAGPMTRTTEETRTPTRAKRIKSEMVDAALTLDFSSPQPARIKSKRQTKIPKIPKKEEILEDAENNDNDGITLNIGDDRETVIRVTKRKLEK